MRNWESKTSVKHQEWDDRILLEVGRGITRGQFTESGNTHFSAARRLNRLLESFQPRGMKELARRLDPKTLFEMAGSGEEVVVAFCHALDIAGGDSEKWYRSDEKMSVLYRRAKKMKKTSRHRLRLIRPHFGTAS